MPATTSAYNVAIVQSSLMGDSKGDHFNDLEKVMGYPQNVTMNADKPIKEIRVMHGGVIDGIRITYMQGTDMKGTDMTHGTSENSTGDSGLKKDLVQLEDGKENIIGICGKQGDSAWGIRVTQLSFAIYNSSTGKMRVAGPFGSGQTGTPFHVTANGNFIAFGGFAIDTNASLGQLKADHNKAGGLYGLTFAEVAYRSV